MKQKSGIILVSIVLFIFVCSNVVAEDENTNSEYEDYFDLGPDEDFMVEIHYETGDMFYHIIAKWKTSCEKYVNSELKIEGFFLFSFPESSKNFYISVEGLENNKIEPILIKNKEELEQKIKFIDEELKKNTEFTERVKVKSLLEDEEYMGGLYKALEEDWLCGGIYPEYLYEKEEFILKIEFDEELNETQKNKFYMNWLVWCIGVTEIENFNHIYFVLPEDAYPWYYNTKDDPFKEKGRNVLLWKIQEIPKTNEGNILIVATFGTLEERLHWENHVNNVENFIYIIAGILLTIILAISFADFGRYRWIKYIALILVLTVFRILFTERIDNFDLEELPIETCLGGECLRGTVDSISKILLIGQIVLVLTFLFLIFRFLRNRTEERSEQEVENGDHGVELEEEVTEGTQELKGVSEEEQGLGEEIETVETKEVTKKKEEHRGEVTEEKSKSEKKEGKLNKRKKEMNRK